ncbi:hypothetical protein WJX73_009510 [Symbiochloris irregularis]|uniref:DNA-directed RNA polymerase n=1 Tax=Symbiochloris irregularis TaxID=706552 RepID=A0AAW1P778_9CHLO
MEAAFAHGAEVPEAFTELVRPHVDSFDYFLQEGLQRVIEHLEPCEVWHTLTKKRQIFWLETPHVDRPVSENKQSLDKRLLPRECREAGMSYSGLLWVHLCFKGEDGQIHRMRRRMGSIPIMLRSKACYLRNLSRKQLVALKEESTEFGGTFISNGIERIIRMLILQRRHHIMAMRRSAYLKRGNMYTESATLLRCVREDEVSATVRCHYLVNGMVNFTFVIRRREFFLPAGAVLKCFIDASDREIFQYLVASVPADSSEARAIALEHAEILLREATRLGLRSKNQAIAFMGRSFRQHIGVHESRTDLEAGQATHERLSVWLSTFAEQVNRDLQRAPAAVQLDEDAYVAGIADVGQKLEYLLVTGNLQSRSGLDMSQSSGFTVVAERLNFFRYMSHFR